MVYRSLAPGNDKGEATVGCPSDWRPIVLCCLGGSQVANPSALKHRGMFFRSVDEANNAL